MQGHQYLHRTHSTLRQVQKLSQLKDELDVSDTASLVTACNKTKSDHERHDALLNWIGSYIPFFEKMNTSECCHKAMEFVQLANIIREGARSKELLKVAFCCLCTKIRRCDYGDEKLIQAFCHFLLSVDHKAFEGNPCHLTRAARDVMQKLGQEETFSRGTYPTHNVSLLALHHLCVVIYAVDPTEFDHDNPTGLYEKMNQCLESIVVFQSYYPIYYQARLTQQSLADMDSNPDVSSKEKRYRMFCALKGTMYVFQSLAGVISANVDFENLEKGVNLWSEACKSRRIKQESWYENVKPLIDARMVVQNDPEKIETFQVCLLNISKLQEQTKSKQDQIALRYTMIRQVTLMALHSPSTWVREWSTEELFHFGSHHAAEKGWAKDPAILEALLDAMLEVHHEYGLESRMEQALQKIRFYLKVEEQSKIVEKWEETIQWDRSTEHMFTLEGKNGDDSLFRRVKKKLSLDETISTRVATQKRLKEYYQQHAEVPSLFENVPCKHVASLAHSLLAYDRALAEERQQEAVKKPIALRDLFEDRILAPGGASQRVNRVLLFGNPGTGKTTIAKKIAYEWSVDEWDDMFDLVFLVPVRELGSIKYDDLSLRTRRNLQTAIMNICFSGENDTNFEALRLQVEEEFDKECTLVVFDGLDEGEEFAIEMIKSMESKSCRVMVLSRPQNLQSGKKSFDLEIECIGLSDEQLVQFLESESFSVEMVKHLRRYPALWEISHTPVVANILIFLYKSRQEDIIPHETNLNMSSLYWKMSVGVWTRYVDKMAIEIQRDVIFETLGKIAFHALEEGQVLIDQQLVRDHSHHRQTQSILKDCGFLLLKREGIYYQFPHLTFQEFFAGQYMAHSLVSSDEERRQGVIDFFVKHKYCANLRQVFRFMVQALIEKKLDRGYLEMEPLVNAEPIALGYQQHLFLKLELLEASLSASRRQQDREKILNSTNVWAIAFKWIVRLIQKNCEDRFHPTIQARNANSLISIIDTKMDQDQLLELFAKVARVARYVPDKWEEIMGTLNPNASVWNKSLSVRCTLLLMEAVPEQRLNLLELYWALLDDENDGDITAAIHKLTDVARQIPGASEQIFEKYKSMLRNGKPHLIDTLLEVGIELAKLMRDRWQHILELMIRRANDLPSWNLLGYTSLIIRFVQNVPESASTAMKEILKWSASDDEKRRSVARSITLAFASMPQNAKEIAKIVWTLCGDGTDDVCKEAKENLAEFMVTEEKRSNPGISALLMLSGSDLHTSHASLVRLVAIAYKWIDGTQNDVDHLLSTLSKRDLTTVYQLVTDRIAHVVDMKSERVTGLHRLHFICVGALGLPLPDNYRLFMRTDVLGSISTEVAFMSIKLTMSKKCKNRQSAPWALYKFAVSYPEYEEDVFNIVDELIDNDEDIATRAFVQLVDILKIMPQRAERTITKCQELIEKKYSYVSWNMCIWLMANLEAIPQGAERTIARCRRLMETFGRRLHAFDVKRLSLDALLKAYLRFHNDILVPFIVWKLFDVPVTLETKNNGQTRLMVQTSSNSKVKYTLETIEETEAFMSLVRKCTERRFFEVASLIPEIDVQDTKLEAQNREVDIQDARPRLQDTEHATQDTDLAVHDTELDVQDKESCMVQCFRRLRDRFIETFERRFRSG